MTGDEPTVIRQGSSGAEGGRPKWSAVVKPHKDEGLSVKDARMIPRNEAQSNARGRSDSVPDLKTPLTEGLLTSVAPPQFIDIDLWDKRINEPTHLSPVRSPIIADWKAVGSPMDASPSSPDPATEQLSNEQITCRRNRAMSLVEKSTLGGVFIGAGATSFSPFGHNASELSVDSGSGRASRGSVLANQVLGEAELSPELGGEAESIPSKSAGAFKFTPDSFGAVQVAQLPRALQEEIGVQDADEATEIFKHSSMDSLDVELEAINGSSIEQNQMGTKSLSNMPSIFGGKLPFGPAAIFGEDGEKEPDTYELPVSRRPSSLFGLSQWTMNPSGSEFSAEDYFGNAPQPHGHRFDALETGNFVRKQGRRHSVASAAFSDQVALANAPIGMLSLGGPIESSLSASAAAFQYKGGFGSYPGNELIDFISMAAGGDVNIGDNYHPSQQHGSLISASAARDVSFQLSTYKGPLYAVEFKAGRTEIFFVLEVDCKPQLTVRVGDLVIVEADRGEDLGKVTIEISVAKLKQLMMPGNHKDTVDKDDDILTPELAALVHSKEIVPKRIHRLAQPSDLKLLQAKAQEEAIAMVRCQSRIRQKKLPMEVVDAEYQWDRNKLTFYFCADRRIDFRELVRDLFRIYKTRIWMCAVDKSSPRMLMYTPGSTASTSNASSDYGGTYYGSFPALQLSHIPY